MVSLLCVVSTERCVTQVPEAYKKSKQQFNLSLTFLLDRYILPNFGKSFNESTRQTGFLAS